MEPRTEQVDHIRFMQQRGQRCGPCGERPCREWRPVYLLQHLVQVRPIGSEQRFADGRWHAPVKGVLEHCPTNIGTTALIAQHPAQRRHRPVQLAAIVMPCVHAGAQDQHQALTVAQHSAGRSQQVRFNDHPCLRPDARDRGIHPGLAIGTTAACTVDHYLGCMESPRAALHQVGGEALSE